MSSDDRRFRWDARAWHAPRSRRPRRDRKIFECRAPPATGAPTWVLLSVCKGNSLECWTHVASRHADSTPTLIKLLENFRRSSHHRNRERPVVQGIAGAEHPAQRSTGAANGDSARRLMLSGGLRPSSRSRCTRRSLADHHGACVRPYIAALFLYDGEGTQHCWQVMGRPRSRLSTENRANRRPSRETRTRSACFGTADSPCDRFAVRSGLFSRNRRKASTTKEDVRTGLSVPTPRADRLVGDHHVPGERGK